MGSCILKERGQSLTLLSQLPEGQVILRLSNWEYLFKKARVTCNLISSVPALECVKFLTPLGNSQLSFASIQTCPFLVNITGQGATVCQEVTLDGWDVDKFKLLLNDFAFAIASLCLCYWCIDTTISTSSCTRTTRARMTAAGGAP